MHTIHLLLFPVLLASLLLLACQDSHRAPKTKWIEISGREPERIPIYRIKIPETWTVLTPDPQEPLTDTKKALCVFLVDKSIRIAVHNFPVESFNQRIPAQAQIQRWEQQLNHKDSASTLISPQSFSGYSGLLLEASGELDNQPATIVGWALQIGAQHFRSLSSSPLPKQMRADVTIKAAGPPEQIAEHYAEIVQAARSFEMIREIPVSR